MAYSAVQLIHIVFFVYISLFPFAFSQLELRAGAWRLGIGLGDMDGWYGDHTIYLLPAGSFVYL